LVGNLSRPDKNATGVNLATTESVRQRLAHLRGLLPRGTKIAVLLRPGTTVFDFEVEEAKKAKLLIIKAEYKTKAGRMVTSRTRLPRPPRNALVGSSSVPIRSSRAGAKKSSRLRPSISCPQLIRFVNMSTSVV
jgi:hypothetical protein